MTPGCRPLSFRVSAPAAQGVGPYRSGHRPCHLGRWDLQAWGAGADPEGRGSTPSVSGVETLET